uniref:Myb-like domain-containing protein n=1 Tax=Sinocyclocheilus rhinocerous TaxID=307959 RepID=A0A673KV62_9TELE
MAHLVLQCEELKRACSGPNFTVAETCALLEGVRANFASIVGGFSSAKCGEATKKGKHNIWEDITNYVNAMGSGQKRTIKQVMLRWKNLRAKTTKDLTEAKNPQTGNKPYKRGDFTDMVLDIIGEEKSEALHGIEGIEADGEATITETRTSEECEQNSPAEEMFVLDLTTVIEEEDRSPVDVMKTVQDVPTRKRKCSSATNQDGDSYELLLKRETERAEVQIELGKEQILLAQLQLEIHLLKAEMERAGISPRRSYKKTQTYELLLKWETERAEVQIELGKEQILLAQLQLEIHLLKAEMERAGICPVNDF